MVLKATGAVESGACQWCHLWNHQEPCYVVLRHPVYTGSVHMARRQKRGLLVARMHRQAQLKIRLPETLRFALERAAEKAEHSMNAEIVRRLSESIYGGQDPPGMAAEVILNGLDEEIVKRIEDMILSANFSDEQLSRMWREKWRKGGLPIPDEQKDEKTEGDSK